MEEGCRWRFVYEALVHLSSLRLLLTNPIVSPILQCARIRASIAFATSSGVSEIVCEWEEEESQNSNGSSKSRWVLRIPLPLCPLDHSAPPQAIAREDHIEVKMKLLQCGPELLRFCTLEPQQQMPDSFSGLEIFRCRNCSTPVTKIGFSSVLNLPSLDWRDATDDWFGVCCCSSSIRTESMVAEFEKNISPEPGKLLLGSTTCIVHQQDLCSSSSSPEISQNSLGGDEASQLPVSSSFYDFLKGPARPSSSGFWEPLRCCKCHSTVGARLESEKENPAVHLLKRYVFAGENKETDPFREHSVQKDFTRELLSWIDQHSEYRCVVRELNSRKAMLRVVVLNEQSLNFCGIVGDGELNGGGLKPGIKAMFDDCSESDIKEMEIVEDWCTRHDVNDIFMFEDEIKSLLASIRSNRMYFPSSYSVTHGFFLSFLAT